LLFEEIGALSPQQQQDIPRVMEIAKKFGLEFLCRPAREYKSSWNQAKAGAREGILR
jgi:hypothetical protein